MSRTLKMKAGEAQILMNWCLMCIGETAKADSVRQLVGLVLGELIDRLAPKSIYNVPAKLKLSAVQSHALAISLQMWDVFSFSGDYEQATLYHLLTQQLPAVAAIDRTQLIHLGLLMPASKEEEE